MKRLTVISFAIVLLTLLIGAQLPTKKNKMFKPSKDFVFIAMGSAKIGENTVSVPPFYMSKTEVTNKQYRAFLADLLEKGKKEDYEKAKIDTSLWTTIDVFGSDSYSKEYHNRDDYPVVNISRQGAELYCLWLTEQFREKTPDILIPEFRLPEKIEWEYAATSGKGTLTNPYPWGGPYCRNAKGCYLAQFKAIGHKLGPVEVDNYFPNEYGLFNMSGNVAEMVVEKDIVKGGHWFGNAEELTIIANGAYKQSPYIGFRPVASFLGQKLNE